MFSLFAASLGIPALAVDILPANLAIIQLSMAATDLAAQGHDDINMDLLLDYISRQHQRRLRKQQQERQQEQHQQQQQQRRRRQQKQQNQQRGRSEQELQQQVGGQHLSLKQYMSKMQGIRQQKKHQLQQRRSRKHRIQQRDTQHEMQKLDSLKQVNLNGLRSNFSDLITTLHNAIHIRRSAMYVHLKEDLNLGGTEVRVIRKMSNENPNFDTHHEHVNNKSHTNNNNTSSSNTSLDQTGKQIHNSGSYHHYNPDSGEADPLHEAKGIPLLQNAFPNTTQRSLRAHRKHEDASSPTRIFVDGVCLDDLIPYIRPHRGVFLKMDVEGSETNVLKCASRFLREADVRVILMEIMFHKYTSEGREMVQFLLHNNMIPSEDAFGKSLLQPGWLWAWPDNVYWVKGR